MKTDLLFFILFLFWIFDLSAQQADFNSWYNKSLSNSHHYSNFSNKSIYHSRYSQYYLFDNYNNIFDNENNCTENKKMWFNEIQTFPPFEDIPRQHRVGRDETPDDPSVSNKPMPLSNGEVEIMFFSLLWWILQTIVKNKKTN